AAWASMKSFRATDGKEATLCYIGNALTENRDGLVVEVELGSATGTIESRRQQTMIVRDSPGSRRPKLGADKAYDGGEFVDDLRDLNITPHIAQNTANRDLGDRCTNDTASGLTGQRPSADSPGPCCAESRV